MSRKIFSFLFILVIIGLFLGAINIASAQGPDLGLNELSGISLRPTSPIIIITRLINYALLLLGVIAISLVIYAGFIWMTSGGNDEKITQAKKILKNALIGLIIILSAWGITTFILTKLLAATGGGSGDGSIDLRNPNPLTGSGALGACTVERVYPEPGQRDVPRNTSIIISFKEALKLDSVCQNALGESCGCDNAVCNLINPNHIRIFRDEFGDSCASGTCPDNNLNISDAIVSASSDHQTFIIKTNALLGKSDGDTDYTVSLTSGLLTETGQSIFKTCRNDFFTWGFQVNNQLDLTPPQVLKNGIFPPLDNERDEYTSINEAEPATASIKVQACPNTYQAAVITKVSALSGSYSASAVIDSNYHSDFTQLTVVSTVDNKQAQLFVNSSLLGVGEWSDKQINFPGFFLLTVAGHEAGSSWQVDINPELLADRLDIGINSYVFSEISGTNNILINRSNCTPSVVATAINLTISGHPGINSNNDGSTVYLAAKVAGEAGNNIYLNSNNPQSLQITAFSGGKDRQITSQVNHRPDKPMNSIIQVNFNEAINPVLVSGLASEVHNIVRVLNADSSALGAGAQCSQDSECQSYNCTTGVCVGDFLPGRFTLSNMFKTLEFRSDTQCGQNACGDPIYCLPKNSQLSVRLRAANLQDCSINSDCDIYSPFSYCGNSNSFHLCQDENAVNYPLANISNLNGVVDAAFNSLDGNRNNIAEGPFTYYNENNPQTSDGDSYQWQFYINDKIMTDPPQISFIKPAISLADVDTVAPMQINFNTLMLNSSLRTGSTIIKNGEESNTHHLLNLITSAPLPLGYWISTENKDVSPLDGEPDKTFVYIHHTTFADSVSYKSQAGSGIKDIYQNCFKPSASLDCQADALNPSCCNGVRTSILTPDGNCP